MMFRVALPRFGKLHTESADQTSYVAMIESSLATGRAESARYRAREELPRGEHRVLQEDDAAGEMWPQLQGRSWASFFPHKQ